MLKKNKNYFQLMSCLEKAKFNLLFNVESNERYNCGILLNKDIDNDAFLNFLSDYFVTIPATIICSVEEDKSVVQSPYYKVIIKKDMISFGGSLTFDIMLLNAWKSNTEYEVLIDKLEDFKLC